MANKKTKIPEGMEYLVSGMEYILIECDVFQQKFYIPATKRESDFYYRISSAALGHVYRQIQRKFRTIRIDLIPELSVTELNHCIALCRLQIDSDTLSRTGDIRAGEVRVTPESDETERRNPFVSAYRKAQNKVIYMDLLGLDSRYFDANGNPVVFFEDPMEAQAFEEKDASDEELSAPVEEEPAPALNSVEEEELSKLSEYVIKTRNRDGSEKIRTISEISEKNEKLLSWFASDCADEEIRGNVQRFIELRNKQAGIIPEAS